MTKLVVKEALNNTFGFYFHLEPNRKEERVEARR